MARRINPERVMRNAHPFDVWKALRRLKVLDKLAGNEEKFYRPQDIAAKMYENWHDLELRHVLLALDCKLSYPIRFLKAHRWIIEEVEHHPSYYTPRQLDAYKIQESTILVFEGETSADVDSRVRQVMDEDWGFWINRR